MNTVSFGARIVLCMLLSTFFGFFKASAYDLVVAKDGSGNYTTVQAAINAAPAGRTSVYTIFIKNGTYFEKINIPSNKPFLQLIGESVANTMLTYNDPATILGTQNSASFSINATDFSAVNISFANTYGDGSQAVAVLVNADRVAFSNCRFLGFQDTLYLKGSGAPRHYFKNCYLDGHVDYIFGSSIAVFDSCVLYPKSKSGTAAAHITAANTPAGQSYGLVFRDCIVHNNTGTTNYYLGRPWQNAAATPANNKTVFLNTVFGGSLILPAGWDTWDVAPYTTNTSLITYGEYKSRNFDGTLKDISQRVPWSLQLNDADAAGYSLTNMFGTWDPCSLLGTACVGNGHDIAVSNFRAIKGSTNGNILWNISWPMTGITYTLYRSADSINYTPVYQTTATTDTIVNYSYTDNLPPANNIYYYYLQATKSGLAAHITDTLIISSKPTLHTSVSTLGNFTQGLGSPSGIQSYTISAENLVDPLVITPPAAFELSNDAGITWYNNTHLLSITPVNGTITSTVINVRLNASALGSYSGVLHHSAANATSIDVALTGNTVLAVTIPVTLIHWPMNVNNQDSSQERSVALQGTIPVLNNMVLSNGTQVPAVSAYSGLYGQAMNSGLLGSGLWSGSGNGGNCSSINRNYYEEFSIKPTLGYDIKIDSFVCNFNFYGGASTVSNLGYKVAAVWSSSHFSNTGHSTDSVNVIKYDSSGLSGVSITGSYTGGFNNPIPVFTKSDATGPVSRFAFLLGTDISQPSVTVHSGEELNVRLYFSCGSGSAGRYATLKDVKAIGTVVGGIVPVEFYSFSGDGNKNGQVKLQWHTTNEMNISQYDVERSSDGVNFSVIGSVLARNLVSNQYNYSDQLPLPGKYYYRLNIRNNLQEVHHSQVIQIQFSSIQPLIIYPNPVGAVLHTVHEKALQGAVVEIYSKDGRLVQRWQIKNDDLINDIAVSNLPGGAYYLVFVNGDVVRFADFIKQ